VGETVSIDKELEHIRSIAQRGQKEAALELSQELLRTNADKAEAWALHASLHARNGNYIQALECTSRAIVLAPERATLYFQRARYNLDLNAPLDAIHDLNEALNKDRYNEPSFTAELYFYRAEAFIILGKKKEALADISRLDDGHQTWTFTLRSKSDLLNDCDKLE